MSTPRDGTPWATPAPAMIDPVTSKVDQYTPGLVIDPATSGSTAHIALTFNFFLNSNCSPCSLGAACVSSKNGGATWSNGGVLGKGINPSWLPSTTSCQMSGEYQHVEVVAGQALRGAVP